MSMPRAVCKECRNDVPLIMILCNQAPKETGEIDESEFERHSEKRLGRPLRQSQTSLDHLFVIPCSGEIKLSLLI